MRFLLAKSRARKDVRRSHRAGQDAVPLVRAEITLAMCSRGEFGAVCVT